MKNDKDILINDIKISLESINFCILMWKKKSGKTYSGYRFITDFVKAQSDFKICVFFSIMDGKMVLNYIDYLREVGLSSLIESYSRTTVKFTNGSEINFYNSSHENILLEKDVDFIFVDEFLITNTNLISNIISYYQSIKKIKVLMTGSLEHDRMNLDLIKQELNPSNYFLNYL